MTPAGSAIEAPTADQAEDTTQTLLGEPLWETAADGVRITRAAMLDEPLVAVVGLGDAGLPSRDHAAPRRLPDRRDRHVLEPPRATSAAAASSSRGAQRGALRGYIGDERFALSESVEAVHAAERDPDLRADDRSTAQGHPDCEALRRTCAAVVRHARAGQTLVLTSTTLRGQHARAARRAAARARPERRRGRVRRVLARALRSRCARAGAAALRRGSWARSPRRASRTPLSCCKRCSPTLHRVSSPAAAEMVKLYESTFRAVNIALAFEMADACRLARPRPDRGDRCGSAPSRRASWRTTPPPTSAGRVSAWTRTCLLRLAARARSPGDAYRGGACAPSRRVPGASRRGRTSCCCARGQQLRDVARAGRRRRVQAGRRRLRATRLPSRSSSGCRPRVCRSTYHDPLVPVLQVEATSRCTSSTPTRAATPPASAPKTTSSLIVVGAAAGLRLRLAEALPAGA